MTVSLNHVAVSGAGCELAYQGYMNAGLDGDAVQTGTATVTPTGSDKLKDALNAAPDDMKAQALIGFGMAHGMAKTEDETLIWQIDDFTPGLISVSDTHLRGEN